MKKPMLTFNKATSQSGFTNASTSASNDKNASVIIREILQNSFDSAIVEAKQETANVKFSLEYIKKDEIPGIDEYEKTIKSIEKLDLSKNEQENDILNVINNELKKDEIPVLFISDNGIGFDPKKMVAILSDGISDKADPTNSGGSYGNGHYSSFNISNFRYVMYGGKLDDGTNLCSGQALLRTHKDDNDELKLGTGFYVTDDKPIEVESDNFPKNKLVPPLIGNKLKEVDTKSGAVIAILGFNFFGNKPDNKKLVDIVTASVVRNFFVAVKEEQLVVEISVAGDTVQIDDANLDEVFKRTKNISAEPSFKTVESFYNTFVNGKVEVIKTKEGNVKVHFNPSDSTSLALCRNGMWICDSLPQPLRRGDFAETKFFNALVLPQKNTRLSNLVRRSEGNLHNNLRYNRFSDDKEGRAKKEDLKQAFKEVKEFLEKAIGKNDNNSFSVEIPDLAIEMISDKKTDTNDTQKKKGSKSKKTKKLSKPTANTYGDEPTDATGDNKDPSSNSNKDNDNKERKRSGNPFEVKKFLSSHDGDNKTAHIKFNTGRKATNLQVSLRIDNGTDPSCDSAGISPRLKIISATSAGQELEILEGDTVDFGVVDKTDLKDVEINYETEVEGHYTIHYEFINGALRKDTNDK